MKPDPEVAAHAEAALVEQNLIEAYRRHMASLDA